MKRVAYPVTLRLRGPILTKSSSIGAPGLDAVMAKGSFRDPTTGAVTQRYYLPGSLVKGLLREAWQELGVVNANRFAGLGAQWLGDEAAQKTNDPMRGRLSFSDFEDKTTDTVTSARRHRIQIDEARGAASARMLQVMESPYTAGQEVEFHGQIRLLAKDDDDLGGLVDALTRGLLWMRAAGVARSSGFGAVLDATIGKPKESRPGGQGKLSGGLWTLRLSFSSPLILSKRQVAGNLFESGDVISGGALKGALAEMIAYGGAAYETLKAELHLVRFTHAFPTQAGHVRPVKWPLSLLSFRKDETYEVVDVIRRRELYLRGEDFGAFDIDWKDEVTRGVQQKYGWPKVPYELRVRTAFGSSEGKARDEDLFAWRMLLPHGFEWVSDVNTTALSELARGQLEHLLRFGLEPLGKTKALANVTLEESGGVTLGVAEDYVIALQTPALLIGPARFLPPHAELGSTDVASLRDELSATWDKLSDGSLVLVNYFQRCFLAGGEYYRRRFALGVGQYRPYLLTDVGSTFLLSVKRGREADAGKHLESWLRSGLPLTTAVRAFYGLPDDPAGQWMRCPYLRENGYGEVSVNHKGPWAEV